MRSNRKKFRKVDFTLEEKKTDDNAHIKVYIPKIENNSFVSGHINQNNSRKLGKGGSIFDLIETASNEENPISGGRRKTIRKRNSRKRNIRRSRMNLRRSRINLRRKSRKSKSKRNSKKNIRRRRSLRRR